MKITISYYCDQCKDQFSAYGNVPDQVSNYSIRHSCDGFSGFTGISGTIISYMCKKCGNIMKADAANMIPALAKRTHGCGKECLPV